MEKKLFHQLSSSSDFYIPERMVKRLEQKIEEHGNLRMFLNYLLDRFRPGTSSDLLPFHTGTKICYQRKGQELQRFSFRPYEKDWIEIMLIARNRGISATFLFLKLFEMTLIPQNDSNEDLFANKSHQDGNIPDYPIRFLQSLDLRLGRLRRIVRCSWSSNK